MAYIPSYLLNTLEKRWHRIQGDAGAAPTLDYPINPGCLYPGNHAGQAERAGRGNVVSLPYRVNVEDMYKDAALGRFLGANWVQNAPKLHPISLISRRQIIP